MRAKVVKFILASAIAWTAGGGLAQTQGFPTKPVTLIVPWPAGTSSDVVMRALAASTDSHLGQRIVVENRVGASGTVAPISMAATGRPDGHTISQIPMSLMRVALVRKTAFNPGKDLTYIIGITGYVFGVVVRSDAPWRTFQEFLADAKARPGQITYGTPGTGTTPHVTMQLIANRLGFDWLHIPFKGSSDVESAILGGHVDAVADASSWASMVNDGRLRLLVTWGAQRTENWPTVPTLRETGTDLVVTAPYGLAGPAGISPDVVRILHDAFKRGMEEPSYRAVLRQFNQVPYYLNSQDYRDFAIREIGQQEQFMKELGLKPD